MTSALGLSSPYRMPRESALYNAKQRLVRMSYRLGLTDGPIGKFATLPSPYQILNATFDKLSN